MLNRTSSSSLLLILSLLLLGGLAQAAPSLLEREGDLFKRAAALYQDGKYEAAVEKFRDAYAVRQHPTMLINIGKCYLMLKNPQEARAAFAAYRRAVPHPSAAYVAELRDYDAQVDELLQPAPEPEKVQPVPDPPVKAAEKAAADPVVPMKVPTQVPKEAVDARASHSSTRRPRPRWRLGVGSLVIAAGIGGVVLGAVSLSMNGNCVGEVSASGAFCSGPDPLVYDTATYGAVSLAGGAALVVAGALMVAWPGERRPLNTEKESAGLRLSFAF